MLKHFRKAVKTMEMTAELVHTMFWTRLYWFFNPAYIVCKYYDLSVTEPLHALYVHYITICNQYMLWIHLTI